MHRPALSEKQPAALCQSRSDCCVHLLSALSGYPALSCSWLSSRPSATLFHAGFSTVWSCFIGSFRLSQKPFNSSQKKQTSTRSSLQGAVFASCCRYNKWPQTRQLEEMHIQCPTLPEVRSIKSRCWRDCIIPSGSSGKSITLPSLFLSFEQFF